MRQFDDSQPDQQDDAPSGLAWAFDQVIWFLQKYVLWPLSDFFRAIGRATSSGVDRLLGGFRYRSTFAYIGATLAVTVTAGAIAAAVYFYDQSQRDPISPVVAQAPVDPADTVVATPDPSARAEPSADGSALKGVVPNFKTSVSKDGGSGAGKAAVVKPAAVPDAPPLKVAHRFASTFVEYEVGEKGAAKKLGQTSTPKLSRALRRNPPKLPANGKVPKATVMNVVKGAKNGDKLVVSVSLMRSGASSELRLGLTRSDSGWRVSEVRG